MCFLACFLHRDNNQKKDHNSEKIIHLDGKFYKLVDFLLIEIKSEDIKTNIDNDVNRNILNVGRK